jgi:spore protease
MEFRTDLALERCEILNKNSFDGIETQSYKSGETKVTRIDVTNQNGKNAVGKPIGRYVTVEVKPFAKHAQFTDESFSVLSDEIKRIIPEKGNVLVAGLGNIKLTPDALGPKCASMIFATRHITGELLKSTGLSGLRSVTAFSTGVLGETGAESSEIIRGVVETVKPEFIITVDALAARNVERLGTTVQMCNTGIVPGSGAYNSRRALDEKTLGVPVIALGVPTVVDADTIVSDALKDSNNTVSAKFPDFLVTPKDIDALIEK